MFSQATGKPDAGGETMIASFFDGRVRIRRDELKYPAAMELVMGFIRNQDGILDLVPNARTGSLLITYDPEKIPRESLLQAAVTLEKRLGPEKKAKPEKRAKGKKSGVGTLSPFAETSLLAALYGVTALTGFTGKRAHIIGALLFTGLTAAHVYTRRKLL